MPNFAAKSIETPSLADITALYRSAIERDDESMKSAAEAAVKHLAVAEAAAAEAATLTSFAQAVAFDRV